MTFSFKHLFFFCALVAFVIVTVGGSIPRVNLTALGLAFLTVALGWP